MATSLRIDLFCQVIDNFGDAGVCWRLARQLVNEHGCRVTLWIDKPSVLKRISHRVDPDLQRQTVSGVDVRLWRQDFPVVSSGDISAVVIEGFGARLPENYVRLMAEREPRPVWINLEYLSAESWVEGSHLMPSPQSWIALTKYFYFPGFTERTGGLIREKQLVSERENFQADRQNAIRFLSQLGVKASPEHWIVSLFCYPDAPVISLLNSFSKNKKNVLCLIPEGVATEQLSSFIGKAATAGTYFETENLAIQVLPMIEQDDFDRLLWSSDFNFIRGEDSFVRAQWAARPFVWHIYPQDGDAHMVKLHAFFDLYLSGLPKDTAESIRRFQVSWNDRNNGKSDSEKWMNPAEFVHEWGQYATEWFKKLTDREDLACGLLRFINTLR